MIKISQLKLPISYTDDMLYKKVCKILKTEKQTISAISIAKRSIDARKKTDIFYSITAYVDAKNEEMLVKKANNKQVSLEKIEKYKFPESGTKTLQHRPVIIGSGPAGLFCAYMLSKHGYAPIVLERGKDVDSRKRDVDTFWESGILQPNSNVQFGEGGAGTFSDGKLNTLIKDKDGKNKEVLSIFVSHGAPESILFDNKPHIGTDVLITVVKNMRKTIEENGGEFRFEHQVIDFTQQDQHLTSLIVQDRTGSSYELQTNIAVLAIGHSARDTFEMLHERNIPMEAKSFAVGFRVEHPQHLIQTSQYGEYADSLPAAAYKVTAKTSYNRGVYSFCMCPGGYVVNASSEQNRLAVNGMSYSDRSGQNANSAIIVAVTPDDFGAEGPLAGVYFQRELEEKAFAIGGGKVPVQYYGDFKNGTLSDSDATTFDRANSKTTDCTEETNFFTNEFTPQIKGQYCYANVHEILPQELNKAFIEGMEHFGKIIPGFNHSKVFVDGIESRTSSPVRIHRDEAEQTIVRGLYPCGEGAGYAGGITSAAMDGMKIAEGIAREFKPLYTIAD